MKKEISFFLNSFCGFCFIFFMGVHASAQSASRNFYEIKIYHLKTKAQEERVDHFLQHAYIPAVHRTGIKKVGVFKPVGNDTAAVRKIVVFIPYASLEQFAKLNDQLQTDGQYATAGKDYHEAVHTDPPYARIESILLQAFTKMPQYNTPAFKAPASERIYELRSYEGPTEKIFKNKVKMFNEGDEIGLFKRLGFNAVFYAEVIAGSRMPNLMYMTSFENQASRDAHWKAFGSDPQWLKLKAMPEYQNNVSKIDIMFMHPTDYSEL